MKSSKNSPAFEAGLIGKPVSHSLSPKLFSVLSWLLGRTIRYKAWEVDPGNLKAALKRFEKEGFAGLNVTIPHKQSAFKSAARLTPEARAIGAVNVLRFSPGGLKGHNTDAAGFGDALAAVDFKARGKDALIFGAGGAARAVGYALGRAGARRVRFVGRTPRRAQETARALEARFSRTRFEVGPAVPAALWVNATPLGMKGFARRSPAPVEMACDLAFDLVYGRRTPFLMRAKARRIKACDGLSMLVYQALRAWEFWTRPLGAVRRKNLHDQIIGELKWH